MAETIGSGTPASAPAGGPAQARETPRKWVAAPIALARRLLITREGSIVVVTVILTLYFAFSLSAFFSTENINTIWPYFAPFAILATGEVFLLINGEIDLSIGGVFLFSPYLYYELVGAHIPLLPSVLIAIVVCTLIGAVNGFFTMVVGINSFITTLGTLFTLQGLTLIISSAQQVTTPGSALAGTSSGTTISTFASVFGGGTYSELIWALVIVAVMQIALRRTRWGLHTVAVGSNRLAAAEAGVRVRLVVIRNFMVCSTCAGLIGILEAVRTSSITPDPSGANSYLLYAIASAVIGGTLLAGGSGTVVGAMIGALFIGILEDGLALKGVNANYLLFWLGLAVLVAMVANVYVGRARRRSGLG